jgi:predicted extracellular nuclease
MYKSKNILFVILFVSINLHGLAARATTIPPLSGVGAASPQAVFAGESTLLTVTVTPGTDPTSTGLTVSVDLSSIGGSATQAFFDDGSQGDVTAGDNVFTYSATVTTSTSPGTKVLPATISDAEGRAGFSSISLTVNPVVAIHDIQGASHISPLAGKFISTEGVVTARTPNGFYMQMPDADVDADPATSEGIFVFTSSAPAVSVGDLVRVLGTVTEFRPGGSSSANLTTTEMNNPGRSVSVLSPGHSLPAPVVIGTGGRVPPSVVIEDDATGSVETSGIFDPETDGIDFYESLEGMRVQVNNPVVVGPTNRFGEIFVLGDDGENAGVRTTRGGIAIRPDDFNPERIQLDGTLVATPVVNVGDHFSDSAVGVLGYSFSNFEVLITSPLTAVPGGLTREVTGDSTEYQLSVSTFNAENLSPNDPPGKFETQAALIVNNLKSPDIIGLGEILDNNGETNDRVVDASATFTGLISAIQGAGGPTYAFRQIDPDDNQDGGIPGGNARVGFLFNPARVSFVDRAGGSSTTAVGVVSGSSGPELAYSPGRIDPTNAVFQDGRKPLAGEFSFRGNKVFVVVSQFRTKGGDDPLFGRYQPPVESSQSQRREQAAVVNDFVDSILTLDPDANVIVAGDLNDYQFSDPLNVLKAGVLENLVDTLPVSEQYSYAFEGNSEVLDHILASNRLVEAPFSFDIVHVNSEFTEQASNHEPEVALLCVDRTSPNLTVAASPGLLWPANHKYVDVTTTVSYSDDVDANPTLALVSVTSNEPDNAVGDDDGDTINDIVIVDDTHFRLRAERSESGTGRFYTITYKVTDACGNEATQSATVTVPLSQGKSKK